MLKHIINLLACKVCKGVSFSILYVDDFISHYKHCNVKFRTVISYVVRYPPIVQQPCFWAAIVITSKLFKTRARTVVTYLFFVNVLTTIIVTSNSSAQQNETNFGMQELSAPLIALENAKTYLM